MWGLGWEEEVPNFSFLVNVWGLLDILWNYTILYIHEMPVSIHIVFIILELFVITRLCVSMFNLNSKHYPCSKT